MEGRPPTSSVSGQVNPDIISKGMGGTGWLVPGREIVVWSNPALLALCSDVELSQSWSAIAPSTNNGWLYRSGVCSNKAKWGAIGLSYSRLQFEENKYIDEFGGGIGYYEPHEDIFSATIGLDIEDLNVLAWFDRVEECVVGLSAKHVRVYLAPPWATPVGTKQPGTATSVDMGGHLGIAILRDEGWSTERERASRLIWRIGGVLRNLGDDIDFGIDAYSPQYKNYLLGTAVASQTALFAGRTLVLTLSGTMEVPGEGDKGEIIYALGLETGVQDLLGPISVKLRGGHTDEADLYSVPGFTFGAGIETSVLKTHTFGNIGVGLDWASTPGPENDKRLSKQFGLRVYSEF